MSYAGLNVLKTFTYSLLDSLEILGQALYVGLSKPYGKVKFLLVSFFVLGMVFLAINTNNIFIDFISTGKSQNPIFSEVYIITVGSPSSLITVLLWGLTFSALFVPVVSNSILSIYNKTSMVSVKRNDMHKVTDSMVLQFASIITLIQLVGVLGIGSILKFTSNVSDMIFLTLGSVWFLFTLFTCLMAWFMELLLRKYGVKVKGLYIAVQASFFGILFLTIPTLNESFFGLDKIIVDASVNFTTALPFLLTIIVATLLISVAVFRVGLYVLNFTVPFTVVKKKSSPKMTTMVPLVGRILWRNGNIKVPILMMVIVSSVAALISGSREALVGFVVAVPMVVSMAAIVNIYGIVGSGNAWLFSVKNFTSKSLNFFMYYNIVVIVMSNIFVALPALMSNKISAYVFVMFIFSSLISGSIMTALGLFYAYKTPNKYDAHIRGENILPPSKSLKVLTFMVLAGGIPAGVVFSSNNIFIALSGAVISMIMCYVLVKNFSRKLNEGLTVNDVISLTS